METAEKIKEMTGSDMLILKEKRGQYADYQQFGSILWQDVYFINEVVLLVCYEDGHVDDGEIILREVCLNAKPKIFKQAPLGMELRAVKDPSGKDQFYDELNIFWSKPPSEKLIRRFSAAAFSIRTIRSIGHYVHQFGDQFKLKAEFGFWHQKETHTRKIDFGYFQMITKEFDLRETDG